MMVAAKARWTICVVERAAQMKDITDKGHQPDPVDRDDDLHGDEDPEVDLDDAEGLSAPLDGKLPEDEDNPDELIQVKVNGDIVEMTRDEAIAGDGPKDTDRSLASVLSTNSRGNSASRNQGDPDPSGTAQSKNHRIKLTVIRVPS
jgi:hypothetical protein